MRSFDEEDDEIVTVVIETPKGSRNNSWDDIRRVDDLGKKFCNDELEEFFVNYHESTGKEYRILGVKGPGAAKRSVEKGLKAAK